MNNFFDMGGMSISGLVIVPFVIVALVMGGIAVRGQMRARASRNWPMAVGKVLFATVDARRSRSGSGYSTNYYPNVIYEYVVNGQRFQNNQMYSGVQYGLGSYKRVEQKVAKYPPGSTVQVYYNPENPSQAVLEQSAPGSKILWFVVLFILVMVAISVAFTFGMNNYIKDLMNNFMTR